MAKQLEIEKAYAETKLGNADIEFWENLLLKYYKKQ